MVVVYLGTFVSFFHQVSHLFSCFNLFLLFFCILLVSEVSSHKGVSGRLCVAPHGICMYPMFLILPLSFLRFPSFLPSSPLPSPVLSLPPSITSSGVVEG